MKKTIYLIFILAMTACSEKDLDQPMAPNLILGEATDITSTTANLHGTVTLHGEKKSQCTFLLSTSSAFDTNVIKQKATKNEGMIDQQISSLYPRTTYYYKMAVTSGYSTVDSESKKFTTAIETPSGTGGTSDLRMANPSMEMMTNPEEEILASPEEEAILLEASAVPLNLIV